MQDSDPVFIKPCSGSDAKLSGSTTQVFFRLRHIPKQKFKVCVLGDQQHCDEAKAKGDGRFFLFILI